MLNSVGSKIEKRSIFLCGCNAGFAMILMLLVSIPAFFLLIFAICGFGGINLMDSLSFINDDTVVGYAANAILSAIIFTVPFILSVVISKRKFSQVCVYRAPKQPKAAFWCALFAIGVGLFGNIIVSILQIVIRIMTNKTITEPEIGNGCPNVWVFILLIISSALAPALVEEFAFRGIILGLLRKFGDWPAIIVSSVLFALMHGNFVQIPFALIVGVCLAITVVVTESVWTAVIVHFIINTFACFATYVFNDFTTLFVMFALIVLGFVALGVLCKNGLHSQIKDVPSFLSPTNRTLRLLFNPLIIVVAVYYIYSAMMFVE